MSYVEFLTGDWELPIYSQARVIAPRNKVDFYQQCISKWQNTQLQTDMKNQLFRSILELLSLSEARGPSANRHSSRQHQNYNEQSSSNKTESSRKLSFTLQHTITQAILQRTARSHAPRCFRTTETTIVRCIVTSSIGIFVRRMQCDN